MATPDTLDRAAQAKKRAAAARARWESNFGKKGYLTKDLKTMGLKAPKKPDARPGLNYGK